MKYKYTMLFGILFGVVMSVLWGIVFSSSLGSSGYSVVLRSVLHLRAAVAFWDIQLIRKITRRMSKKF